jgi:Ca2+-binding EF-hand superfamily protein
MNMNPRKHQARRPRSNTKKNVPIDFGNDSDSHSATFQIMKNHEEAAASKNISSLNPDTLRWINKRKKLTGTNSVAGQVLPSKAVQLRDIFKSLDTEKAGVINIKSIKTALRTINAPSDIHSLYSPSSSLVSNSPTLSETSTTVRPFSPSSRKQEQLISDPQLLLDFFTEMDSNQDGIVDFNDFLAAMTNEPTTEAEKGRTINPQEEFFDFATKHRRHKIMEFVKSRHTSDLDKYEELKKLFQLTYFTTGTTDLSVNDKLIRVKAELQKKIKELHSDHFLQRKKKEILRAREASLFFDSQRKKFDDSVDGIASAPGLLSKNVMMEDNEVDKKIRKRFAQFALHNNQTYTPHVSEVPKTQSSDYFRKTAREDAYHVRNDKYLARNIPPILPPISMKEKLGKPTSSGIAMTKS